MGPISFRRHAELLSVALTLAIGLHSADASARSCSNGALRVGVDVGHSRTAPGAMSATGRPEYEFNKRFAEELIERGKTWSSALQLLLLNPSGREISLERRPREAADRKVDLFVSIHHDSVNKKYMRRWEHQGRSLEYSDVFKGFSLFVWEQGPHAKESIAIASLMGKYLRSAGVSPTLHHAEPIAGENRRLLNREVGVYSAPFAVLKSASMPAVLFEVGIIANREEERELNEPSYRARIQSELLGALVDYCGRR